MAKLKWDLVVDENEPGTVAQSGQHGTSMPWAVAKEVSNIVEWAATYEEAQAIAERLTEENALARHSYNILYQVAHAEPVKGKS